MSLYNGPHSISHWEMSFETFMKNGTKVILLYFLINSALDWDLIL